MPNSLRPGMTGPTVFFTLCLAERGTSLLTDHIDLLRESVRHTRTRRPFAIEAWVVLPDHMHAIWTLPVDDPNFSQRWGTIKARFSKFVRRRGAAPALPGLPGLGPGAANPSPGAPGIWQRRFREHHVRGPEDHAALVRRCHTDPVRHGLADRPDDWLFSSVHRDIRDGRWVPDPPLQTKMGDLAAAHHS